MSTRPPIPSARNGVAKPTSLVINLLLAFASPIIFLLGVELAMRATGLGTGTVLVPTNESCVRRSRLLSMEFAPDCAGDLAGTTFHTNALGLRVPEVRDDGAARVLALGDSCTWGWRVEDGESYPALLQQLLDAEVPGRYAVINAGVPGYTSYQGLEYLRTRGLALAPAIVLIGYGFNDLFETGDVEVQLALERRGARLLALDDFLLARSTAYRVARQAVNRMAPKPGVRATPQKYRRNLEEMIRLASEHGARVLLLSFWMPGGSSAPYSVLPAAVAAETHVPLLVYAGPRLDVVHPTAEGYRLLARQIRERLETEGYVSFDRRAE